MTNGAGGHGRKKGKAGAAKKAKAKVPQTSAKRKGLVPASLRKSAQE